MGWAGNFVGIIDTEPGSPSPLAPPHGFSGDGIDYLAVMRLKTKNPAFRQQMHILARTRDAQISGPYAAQAKHIIDKYRERYTK